MKRALMVAAFAFGAVSVAADEVTIIDRSKLRVRVSPLGEMMVNQPFRLAGVPFVGTTVDVKFWTAATSGAGSAATQAGGVGTVSSGTANSGYGQFSSVQAGRFMFAHPIHFRAAVRIPDTTEAACTRRWGAFSISTVTPQDGHYFEVSPTGVLSVVSVTGGTATAVPSTSFNGRVSGYSLDDKVHAYEIVYFTMGVWFYIDNTLVHTTIPTTAPLTATLDVPATITAVNSASGTESGSVTMWNAILERIGRPLTEKTSYYHATGQEAGEILKRGSGVIHSLEISSVSVNSVVTIYDNTAASGTIIWASGTMPAITAPFSVKLDLPFWTGLTLVVATADCSLVAIYE